MSILSELCFNFKPIPKSDSVTLTLTWPELDVIDSLVGHLDAICNNPHDYTNDNMLHDAIKHFKLYRLHTKKNNLLEKIGRVIDSDIKQGA